MAIPRYVFRAYDIRGVVAEGFDERFAFHLGRALARKIGPALRVGVGRDCRLHGVALQSALMDGLKVEGCRPFDLGLVPSPLVYFSVYSPSVPIDFGVVVTASHNPKEDNGFKFSLGEQPFYGEALVALYNEMCVLAPTERRASAHESLPVAPDYLSAICADVHLKRPVRVVVDGGNGAGGELACELFRRLGAEVYPLYCEPDGEFPNHHPDPTVEQNLVDLALEVRRVGADLGIGLDGDGDRLGVVNERGEMVVGDRLLLILARHLLLSNPGACVIGEVKCSQDLFQGIEAAGGRSVMSAVGHSILKERMVSEGALLAGEMSGHIYFADRYFGFDDALYAGARLMEILSEGPFGLSRLLEDVPEKPASPEIRVECPDAQKHAVVEQCISVFRSKGLEIIDIDGARVVFDDGWALVRASNTQPTLVLRVEANTRERLEAITQVLRRVVDSALSEVVG